MSAKLFLMVIPIMLIAFAAQAQEFVTDGLIAMWTMDSADIDGDTVKDVSGNGNDATIMGSLKFVAGVIGEAALFEATPDSYIEIPEMPDMEQDSVECWAYEEAFSGIQGIVSTWQWEAGKIHFKFESNEIQVDKNGTGKIRSAAQPQTWYHIVYTMEVGGKLQLFVDGELRQEVDCSGPAEFWNVRRIGSEHDGRYLNGMIDEVRVYDRVLEPEEVMQNFNTKTNIIAMETVGKLATAWGAIRNLQD
jgi:hypothetical protein